MFEGIILTQFDYFGYVENHSRKRFFILFPSFLQMINGLPLLFDF